MKKSTSWGEEFVLGEYQKDLILPNIIRVLDIKKGESVLDLACGPGFFAREFYKKGAKVIGVDISRELVAMAKKYSPAGIDYHVGSAEDLSFLKSKTTDKAIIILAIQNIKDINAVFSECARVLKPSGKLFIVMNHPAFRMPKESSWGWDEKTGKQYRRIDRYMTDYSAKIEIASGHTLSFHRPLQVYFKAFRKAGFCVDFLEEWISHKKSQPGPRASAENEIRKEIPLFLFLRVIKRGEA